MNIHNERLSLYGLATKKPNDLPQKSRMICHKKAEWLCNLLNIIYICNQNKAYEISIKNS